MRVSSSVVRIWVIPRVPSWRSSRITSGAAPAVSAVAVAAIATTIRLSPATAAAVAHLVLRYASLDFDPLPVDPVI
jgi:hypothetical protein